MNSAVVGNSSEIIMGEGINLPSYQNVLNRVERMENTISKFAQGKGVVEVDDGSYRKIKVDLISKPADNISGLSSISTFGIDSNWFFESLQYPRCVVRINLKGKIDDASDRVYVNRIIIDTEQDNLTDEIKSNILSSQLGYGSMIDYLDNSDIIYREDRDETKLPLTYEKNRGRFQIINTAIIKNTFTSINEMWYYLSDVKYSTVTEDGAVETSENFLSVDDLLRFGDSVYRIVQIDHSEKRVRLGYDSGYDIIGTGDVLEIYNNPFKEKVISVGIGINEICIIYVKGVNENYNLLSREWSNPVIFNTNDLLFEENSTIDFVSYYRSNIADFGRRLIGQYKEGQLTSYEGKKPYAPTLVTNDLRVVQINTQLNATLDNEEYNRVTAEIASVKSNISAVRTTIATNKDKLIQATNKSQRNNINNTINNDTEKLNNLTAQFSSLVEELNTMLNTAGAINYVPKYHVRGFFSIPQPRYDVEEGNKNVGKQQIIGFETMYRYLHVDESGQQLNTFDYTNSDNILETGVFTDWNLSVSPFLEKSYDKNNDRYEWVNENVDGTHISINQVDVPIRSGEKVEIKVRSISEAGYPYNPLKSDWSNSVIISFPDNLTSDNSVTNVLDMVKNDMTSVTLQETLSAAGIYTHVADANSLYKHNSDNIEFSEIDNDKTSTMSVAEKIRALSSKIKLIDELQNKINELESRLNKQSN
jgi:hypothetical protein